MHIDGRPRSLEKRKVSNVGAKRDSESVEVVFKASDSGFGLAQGPRQGPTVPQLSVRQPPRYCSVNVPTLLYKPLPPSFHAAMHGELSMVHMPRPWSRRQPSLVVVIEHRIYCIFPYAQASTFGAAPCPRPYLFDL